MKKFHYVRYDAANQGKISTNEHIEAFLKDASSNDAYSRKEKTCTHEDREIAIKTKSIKEISEGNYLIVSFIKNTESEIEYNYVLPTGESVDIKGSDIITKQYTLIDVKSGISLSSWHESFANINDIIETALPEFQDWKDINPTLSPKAAAMILGDEFAETATFSCSYPDKLSNEFYEAGADVVELVNKLNTTEDFSLNLKITRSDTFWQKIISFVRGIYYRLFNKKTFSIPKTFRDSAIFVQYEDMNRNETPEQCLMRIMKNNKK